MSKKKNPTWYMSNGAISAMKRGITREMFESFEVIWMTVMRDKFGFGADRLAEIMEDTHAVGEAILDNKITVESMIVDLAYNRGVQVTDPDFIRRSISSVETYWTAKDMLLPGGRTYKASDLRNLRLRTERDTWLSCETIWLYTLQLKRRPRPQKAAAVSKRRDTFGTDRLRRAQAEARALGAELAEHRISIADLREVLREEAHIVLQRPVPREAEVSGQ